MRERFDLKTEAKLALLPTVMMMIVLLLMEIFGRGHLLFASLASSAFLVYLDPKHPANSIYTMVMAQVAAALIGIAVISLLGPGYSSAITAMFLAIVFMVMLNVMHPPAVSTAITFGFASGGILAMFLIALGLLLLLVILQQLSLLVINRRTDRAAEK